MAESRSSTVPTGLTAAAVFVVALLAFLLLFRSGGGGRAEALLGEYDPAAVEASVAERLDDLALRPSPALRVTGQRIEWRDEAGRPFLRAPRLSFSVRVGAGPGGGVLISDGVARGAELRLIQLSEDTWNYEQPLAPFLDGDGSDGRRGGGPAVRMRNMRLSDTRVVIELLDATYEARSLDAQVSSARLSGPGLDAPTFDVARASATLVLPDTADGEVVREATLANARIRLVDGATTFDVASATFGGSSFAGLQGVWDPDLGGYGLDLRATGTDVRVADLPWLPGEVPEGATGRFEMRLEPRPGDRTAVTLSALSLQAPGSSATGSFTAVVGGVSPVLEAVDLRVDPLSLDLVEAFTGPLPYGGTVVGTIQGSGDDIRVDLEGRLTTPTRSEPFRTDLEGRLAFTDEGVRLHGAEISLAEVPLEVLDAVLPGLPLRGPVTGTVRLSGGPTDSPLTLDLRMETAGGIVTVEGRVDLTGAVPAYDVSGRLVGVDLRALLEPAAPPLEIHAGFAVEGRGADPATAVATASVNGLFTGWHTESGDTLAIEARVAEGVLALDAFRAEAGPISIGAAGEWDFVGPEGGALSYEVDVTSLEPLAPYLPADPDGRRRFARGSLRTTGTLAGTLDAPRVEGEVAAEQFRWGEYAAESLSGDYLLDQTNGLPRAVADLSATELRTTLGDFDSAELAVDFGRPEFMVSFQADQEGGGGIVELEASGRIEEEGGREVTVRRLEVDLEEQRWRLNSPAEVAWTAGDVVRVDGFRVTQVEGDGVLSVGGIVAPLDAMDLTLEVERLPVGDVLALTGTDVALAGELSLRGSVTGPAGAPQLDLEARLMEGEFRGVTVRSADGRVGYEGSALTVDGTALLGDSARVTVEGEVPARLQLAGGPFFQLVDDGTIDLSVITRTFPLSTIEPGIAMAEDIEGSLQANIRVTGSPASPQLRGSAELLAGAVTVPMLDKRFTGIQGAVVLGGREATVRRLVVESGGTATLRGALDFRELTNPSLDLTAVLEAFRPQGVEDHDDAAVWGEVQLSGRLQDPVLTGHLRAGDGDLSLAPLRQPELSARLSGAGALDLSAPGGDFELGSGGDGGGIAIRDLRFTALDDLWFVTEEARLQLGGTLVINKTGDDVAIQGSLAGSRGTFELAAGYINRQFQIVSSSLRFFGSPEPNPRIDIVASRTVRLPEGGDVDVRVRVTGTLQNPALNLGTASGADIQESELLSFLLFGRSTTRLSEDVAGMGGVGGFLGQGLAYTGWLEAGLSSLTEEIGVFDYFMLDYRPPWGFFATAGIELLDQWFATVDLPLLGAASDYWAAGVEYRWGRIGTFRGATEPVERLDRFVGNRRLLLTDEDVERQLILSWRRRWTY